MELRRIVRTLRFQLAVMNALVLGVITLSTLIFVRQGVEWTLYREFDQLLQEDFQEVSLGLQQHPPIRFALLQDELNRKSQGHRQHSWFTIFRDAENRSVWKSEGVPENVHIPTPVRPLQPFESGGFRLIVGEIKQGMNGVRSVIVGASLKFLQRDLQRIDNIVTIALVVTTLLAPLSGYWLAKRATRQIGDIILTASRLRPNRLEERLKLRGTNDELDLLAKTVNGFLDRIAEYLKQRRDFLANAAHELRTPLAAIRSSIEVALDGRDLTPDEQSLLEDLIDQLNSLELLVNQLLVLTETENTPWRHTPELVPIHDVLYRATEMFNGVAEQNGVTLTLTSNAECFVAGSQRYLRQVMNNLIDNAVKYTPAGGTIQISLERHEADRTARLTITDTGLGISEEDLPRVFDRFFRGDRARGREQAVRGTGLGLSICKAVVNAHNGSISCKSTKGVGTTVEVALPLAEEPATISSDHSAAR